MSIINKRFSFFAIVFAGIVYLNTNCLAQEIEATVEIVNPTAIKINGKLNNKKDIQSKKNWSFARSIAGIENLATRISELVLTDEQGKNIPVKELIPGEYLANENAASFSYQVNFTTPLNPITAHASWLTVDKGLLLSGDLLPHFESDNQPIAAKLRFVLPADWKVISNEEKIGGNIFLVNNLDKATFLVGKDWRESKISLGNASLNLAISGDWQFSDAEAAKMASEIYEKYRQRFGENAAENVQVSLFRFPKEIKFGRWNAETRGASVTIVSADMAFKAQALQLLHEQFRHELLHLWMPNNLALTGNYDWFYEGFTIYQALRTGLEMNQIRFEDFLDTLAQAYNFDNFQDGRASLINASKNRFQAAGNPVYARGMLVAFLCDVALLTKSKGRISVEQLLQEIYRKHRNPNKTVEGNEAIIKIIRKLPELNSIVEKYVLGAEEINWKTDLQIIGIETFGDNFAVRLKVKDKLNDRQKDLLNKLGYNNWRKIVGKSK